MNIRTMFSRNLFSRVFFFATLALTVFGLTAALPGAAPLQAQATAAGTPQTPADQQLQERVIKALKNSYFKDVKVSVANGIVSLSGNVKLYADKDDAYRKAHHIKEAAAIRNLIEVAGPVVSDAEIYKKLSEKIAWDRIGYSEIGVPEVTPFNAIDIHVRDGVVTLTGHAYGPVDKDNAVSLAEYFPGVKDVIDDVQVDPVSDFDDRTRMQEYRAIYGYPSLSMYGADPAKPIRITVINGTVILSGVVNNETDKRLAGLRANGVPNVFKVINNLQVAGHPAQEPPTTGNSVSK